MSETVDVKARAKTGVDGVVGATLAYRNLMIRDLDDGKQGTGHASGPSAPRWPCPRRSYERESGMLAAAARKTLIGPRVVGSNGERGDPHAAASSTSDPTSARRKAPW